MEQRDGDDACAPALHEEATQRLVDRKVIRSAGIPGVGNIGESIDGAAGKGSTLLGFLFRGYAGEGRSMHVVVRVGSGPPFHFETGG